MQEYVQDGSFPVKADTAVCAGMVDEVIASDFAAAGTLWRHSPEHLAASLMALV
jgi:hypothetical protein